MLCRGFPLGDAEGGGVGVPRALEEGDEALRHREGENQLRSHDDYLGGLSKEAPSPFRRSPYTVHGTQHSSTAGFERGA